MRAAASRNCLNLGELGIQCHSPGYEDIMTPVRTAAYGMLAATFVKGGADAVMNPERYAPRAKPVTDRVAPSLHKMQEKIPTEPEKLVRINGAVQAVGGALLLTKMRRLAAVVLAGSLVPTTAAGHAFWTQDSPEGRSIQMTNFLKNAGLFGGLLLAAVDRGSKPSMRWRASHLAHDTSKSIRRGARHQREKANIAMKAAAAARRLPG